MKTLLGRKVGMTHVYDSHGTVRPVTVVQAGPCVVTAIKSLDRDGYQAVQLSFGQRKRMTKPTLGHLKQSGQTSAAVLREFRISNETTTTDLSVGAQLDVTIFSPGDQITVSATSKGKGYAGVVKRHGFAGGPASHGSDFHRAPGAIGGRWPQRVVKGRRMAGHMGSERVTVKGLEVIQVDPTHHLLAIAGAIPGPKRGIIELRGEA